MTTKLVVLVVEIGAAIDIFIGTIGIVAIPFAVPATRPRIETVFVTEVIIEFVFEVILVVLQIDFVIFIFPLKSLKLVFTYCDTRFSLRLGSWSFVTLSLFLVTC